MKFNTRELVRLAVFGVLWGIVEISLGSVLKSLHIPFSGAVLGAIGLMIAMIGRVFVPRKGATLFIGVIAMFIKLFSLGGIVIGPMIGILAEALIAELVLSLGGDPRRILFMLAGALGVLWCLIQPLITNPLLFGRSMMVAWLDMIDQGSRLLGLGTDAKWLILLGLMLIYLGIGAGAGWLAWDISAQLRKRLARINTFKQQPTL